MRYITSGQILARNDKNARASSLLFVGVLLFATLVVPGIALTTQWVMDVPIQNHEGSGAQPPALGAQGPDLLIPFGDSHVLPGETGSSGRHCSPRSGLGTDAIFTGLCTEIVK